MLTKMKQKAQAGLEYLMTYGWALIMIATIIGVLVFIISSPTQNVTFSSSEPTKMMLKGGAVSGTTAQVKMQNITGGDITITKITTSGTLAGNGTLNGTPFTSGATADIPVPAGSEMSFTGLTYTASASTTGNISIEYTDYAGLQRTTSLTASGGTGTTPTPPSDCGNGTIDSGEACDGTNLNGEDCISQGYLGGTLTCNTNCLSFNTSACTTATCGNGIIEGSEECDGAALGGATCVSEGYANCAGTLPGCSSCTLTQGTCKTDLLCGAGSFNSATGWSITGGTVSGGKLRLDGLSGRMAVYNFGTQTAGTYRTCIDATCYYEEYDYVINGASYPSEECGWGLTGNSCCNFVVPSSTSQITIIGATYFGNAEYYCEYDNATVVKIS